MGYEFIPVNALDWGIIIGFLVFTLVVGIIVSKKAGESSEDFFLSGRSMPWWLLGFSMVATTFSTDTPNLVTDMVRQGGVAQNWSWWAFLMTGMLTTFIYSKLWRRSGVVTDLGFYELRYSGKSAAFLRGFRAVYLGFLFNIIVMATVSMAAIKIGGVMLGLKPWETVIYAAAITTIFSVLGGLKSVLITDCLLFIVAMVGSVAAAVVSINRAGGLDTVLNNPLVQSKMDILPSFDIYTPGVGFNKEALNLLITLLLMPVLVQWWSAWYPGAEPGGGGYLTQRVLAAKNEAHATGSTLFFDIAHYALRPWPWLLVALASLVLFPTLDSLKAAFPHTMPGHDLAYSAMLTMLPHGLKGIVVASLMSAYISTISTHLNWGSSYITYDFWKRFARPKASEKEMVLVGRVATVILMVLACVLSLYLKSATFAFKILVGFGAGTGLVFILRWFWWRINAWCEIAAMTLSFIISTTFVFWEPELFKEYTFLPYLVNVAVTTIVWVALAYIAPATDTKTLRSFYRHICPGGPGWDKVIREANEEGDQIDKYAVPNTIPQGILCMIMGTILVYSLLFSTGFYIYGKPVPATCLLILVAACGFGMFKLWPKLYLNND